MIVFIVASQPDGISFSICIRFDNHRTTVDSSIERLVNYTTVITYEREINTFKYKVYDKKHIITIIPIDPVNDWIVQTLTLPC